MAISEKAQAIMSAMAAQSKNEGRYVRCPVCNAGKGRECLGAIHPERIAAANAVTCPECFVRGEYLRVDRSGRAVCDGCFVPERYAVGPDTAMEAIFVAPPSAKNVTPR